jgi:hypothetical protein
MNRNLEIRTTWCGERGDIRPEDVPPKLLQPISDVEFGLSAETPLIPCWVGSPADKRVDNNQLTVDQVQTAELFIILFHIFISSYLHLSL